MKKKERKERRKNLKEHRAQLRENTFLGVFTSIAEYTRRQTLRNINCVMTNHYAIWTDLRYRLLSARMLAHASRKQSENSWVILSHLFGRNWNSEISHLRFRLLARAHELQFSQRQERLRMVFDWIREWVLSRYSARGEGVDWDICIRFVSSVYYSLQV